MPHTTLLLTCLACSLCAGYATAQAPDEVPVTIKELDVEGAIREFRGFQARLGQFRDEIGAGREIAKETSQILAELRATASEENGYNEAA
ncbi:MAG: hypothetical protein E2O39_10940, partial [Planctomycetota bacterium]